MNVLRAAFRWTICSKPVDAAFPYEVAFDVGGPKGCGKGVTSEVLRALSGGSHGVGTLRSKMFGDPDSLASLLNKKAAIDFDSSGIVTDPGCFNSIVSNEPVQIWIKYKNKCDARFGCVIWRFYNDQPRVADDGGVTGSVQGQGGVPAHIPGAVGDLDVPGRPVPVDVLQIPVRPVVIADGGVAGRVQGQRVARAHNPVAIVEGLTGSVTYKVRAETGAGSCNAEASPTAPAWFMVEDVGPATV